LTLTYPSADLEILAFPCNNFGAQEPGSNTEVVAFAKGKGAKYPIMGKLECENAEETAPFYKFLRASISNGLFGQGLKWNFTKFLCDANGVPVKRYAPTTSPLGIVSDIEELINKK
jgi:glutathione peroxidase